MFSPPRKQSGYTSNYQRNYYPGPPSPRFNGFGYPPNHVNSRQSPQSNSGGLKGFFQRFFKSSNQEPSPMGNFPYPQAGNYGYGNSGGFTDKLGNIQQVLSVAQKATPMIREYGPMIKNIPTMIAMVKAFNEAEEDDEEYESTSSEDSESDASAQLLEDELESSHLESESVSHKLKKKNNNQPIATVVNNENIYKMETDIKEQWHVKNHQNKKIGTSTPKIFY